MAKITSYIPAGEDLVFVRVGWMRFYNGSVPGDERPIGGGKYNQDGIGHEIYNFRETDGRLYGYFQPPMSSDTVALERINSAATASTASLKNVLVIFVARRPEGGQVIVGWQKGAELFRRRVQRSPGKPRGFGYFCSASSDNACLLPAESRHFEIPSGKDGMGQSNICYPLTSRGAPKNIPWMSAAVNFVNRYRSNNIFVKPEADAEVESAAAAEKAIARSKGQGFARDAVERRAIERHAMAVATKHFVTEGFDVEDVSAFCPYDLLCTRGKKEIHVEVKGTTTDGGTIVLTYNEGKHASDTNNECVLFVLHSISLKGKKAVGGTQVILNPWRLDANQLVPITYTYRLKGR